MDDAADRALAWAVWVELESRITTQDLPYAVGDDATALSSVAKLFDKGRDLMKAAGPAGGRVVTPLMHMLNEVIRPTTAKWHRHTARGDLRADLRREFRSDLDALRVRLRAWARAWREASEGRFDTLSGLVGGGEAASATGPSTPSTPSTPGAPVDLAISGGGIRSATFGLGVLDGLGATEGKGWFRWVSTVSGGGYVGIPYASGVKTTELIRRLRAGSRRMGAGLLASAVGRLSVGAALSAPVALTGTAGVAGVVAAAAHVGPGWAAVAGAVVGAAVAGWGASGEARVPHAIGGALVGGAAAALLPVAAWVGPGEAAVTGAVSLVGALAGAAWGWTRTSSALASASLGAFLFAAAAAVTGGGAAITMGVAAVVLGGAIGLWILSVSLDPRQWSVAGHYETALREVWLGAESKLTLNDVPNVLVNVVRAGPGAEEGADELVVLCGRKAPERREDTKGVTFQAEGDLDAARAMALSGAAVDPRMGRFTVAGWRPWLSLLNVRLGGWPVRPHGIWHGLTWRFREALGLSMDGYVTDGGHLENTGALALFAAGATRVVILDGEEDRGSRFDGLAQLQRLLRRRLKLELAVDVANLVPGPDGVSVEHFAVGRVTGVRREAGYTADVLYVKPTLSGDEPLHVAVRRLLDPSFPHPPTTHQVFDEAQTEAVLALGQHIGTALREACKRGGGDNASTGATWFDAVVRAARAGGTSPLA